MQEFARASVGNAGYGDNLLILLYQVVSQSTATNTSQVRVQVLLRCPVYVSTSATYLSVNGGSSYQVGSDWSAGDHIIYDSTLTVNHNNSGQGSLSFSATISSTYLLSGTVSGTVGLPTIPRYATITSFTVSKRDETSVKFNYTVNATTDWAWYSKDNGASWQNLAPSNIITGLTANTTYNFKLRVRRQDSQLTTDSGTVQQATYNYPYVTAVGTSNLTIGNSQKLTLYNPLSRSVTIRMSKDSYNGTQLYSGTTSSTSITFTPNANTLYASIPSATSGRCVYSVIYGSVVRTTGQYTYSINVNQCKPTFSNFEYSTDLSNLTGDNDTVINGITTATITISSANKAVAKNSATITKYSVQIGNMTPKTITYSSSADVSTNITNCNSTIVRVTAIDSRNLETTVTKTIANFKDYFAPSFSSTNAEREDGVEENSYLDLVINFWNKSFGVKNNTIKEIRYRVKQSNSSTWSDWALDAFKIDLSQLEINNNEARLENYPIHTDGISGDFTIGQTYDVQVKLIDGTSDYQINEIISSVFTLTDGQVALSIFRDNNGEYHIGINGMPDANYTLKVHGTINNS